MRASSTRALSLGILTFIAVRVGGQAPPQMELNKQGAVVGTKSLLKAGFLAPPGLSIAGLTVDPPGGVTLGAPSGTVITPVTPTEAHNEVMRTVTVAADAEQSRRTLRLTFAGTPLTRTADFWIEPRRMIIFAIDGLSLEQFERQRTPGSFLSELFPCARTTGSGPSRSVCASVRTTFPPITWSRWTTVFSGRTSGDMRTAGTGWLNRAALLTPADDSGDVVQGLGTSDLSKLFFMYYSDGAFNRNPPIATGADGATVYAELRERGLRNVVVLSPGGYGVRNGDDAKRDRWHRLSLTMILRLILEGESAAADEHASRKGRQYAKSGDFNLLVLFFPGLDHEEHKNGLGVGDAWFARQLRDWIEPVVREAEEKLHGTVVYGMAADHGLFAVSPEKARGFESFRASLAALPTFHPGNEVRENDDDRVAGRLAGPDGRALNVVYSEQGGMANVYVADGAASGDATVVNGDWKRPPSIETLEPLVDALHAAYMEPYLDVAERPVAAIVVRERDPSALTDFTTSTYKVVSPYYQSDHQLNVCGPAGNQRCTLASQLIDLETMDDPEWGVVFEKSAPIRMDGYASPNSGDVVLLANAAAGFHFDPPESNIKAQHGGLMPIDSRVPLAFSYPGATGTRDQDDTLNPIEDQLASDPLAPDGFLESPVEIAPVRAFFRP